MTDKSTIEASPLLRLLLFQAPGLWFGPLMSICSVVLFVRALRNERQSVPLWYWITLVFVLGGATVGMVSYLFYSSTSYLSLLGPLGAALDEYNHHAGSLLLALATVCAWVGVIAFPLLRTRLSALFASFGLTILATGFILRFLGADTDDGPHTPLF